MQGFITYSSLETLNKMLFRKDCFDFLSEPSSFMVLYDLTTQEIKLVVKISPDILFVREIVKDPTTDGFRLEFNMSLFVDIDCLLDHYHENFMYDWSGSTVRRIKLKRAVYNHVLSLQYLAGSVLKRNQINIVYTHL